MKGLTLVERIEDIDKITIKYSFGTIIIAHHFYDKNTPVLTFQKENRSEWIAETYISDYTKICLMSGIEELAADALLEYHKTLLRRAEFFKP